MNYLYHLSAVDGFDFDLTPPSLESEGFVHLSARHQVLRTANRWFGDYNSLKLLVLKIETLEEHLKWEDTHGHGEPFPHYYGPLPAEAIHTVATLERNPKGDFSWPDTISALQSPLLEPPVLEAALIEPSRRFPKPQLPENCLLCFFPEIPKRMEECRPLEALGSAIGAHTLYQLEDTVICCPGFGAPVATAALEELIALGCKRFLVCGGAGSLHSEQSLGHLVLVSEAFRDEGTSHHYLETTPTVKVPTQVLETLRAQLQSLQVRFDQGATWTTDALYRETPSRLERRRQKGCLTVEMEMASLLAVAQYRGVELGGLLCCGDDLGAEEWDFREWTSDHSNQEKLFWLSLELLKSE